MLFKTEREELAIFMLVFLSIPGDVFYAEKGFYRVRCENPLKTQQIFELVLSIVNSGESEEISLKKRGNPVTVNKKGTRVSKH